MLPHWHRVLTPARVARLLAGPVLAAHMDTRYVSIGLVALVATIAFVGLAPSAAAAPGEQCVALIDEGGEFEKGVCVDARGGNCTLSTYDRFNERCYMA